MAGVPRSLVKENAREQLLSSDLNRIQWLASREAQDLEGQRASSLDSSAAIPTSPANLLAANGTPISGVDKAPTLVFDAGYSFNMGAGSGHFYDPTFATLAADDSAYLVMRWPAQAVTFANPHATLPRIDVVVATAGAADTDSQSRIILVDPVTRAVTPQNVFKTSNPLSTISVVTGAAGANPAVPAIPADSIPLFYVWVVAAAPDGSTFGMCRASWRRAPYPLSAMTGVISGMGLLWDQQTAFSSVCPVIIKGFHRVVIDGELLEFFANMDSTVGGFAVDTGANPFGAAAPATWNKPYYIYAVGGRHNPKPSFNTADGFLSPVTIVESTIAPDLDTNRPSANMTVGGTTITPRGAVYIGLGFVAMNTTNRASCWMTEEMTFCNRGTQNVITHTWAAAASESIGTLQNIPAISNRIRLVAKMESPTLLTLGIAADRGDGAGVAGTWGGSAGMLTAVAQAGDEITIYGEIPCFAGNGEIWGTNDAAGTAEVYAQAFNHRVGRVGFQVNP
jgi:hypothetical protein